MNPKQFYRRFCNTPFKRVLFWLSIGGFTFCLSVFSLVWFLQDTIIQRFVQDANRHLAVKVDAPTINVTALPNFPDVSIAFDRITVYEANARQPDTLAHIKTLYFTFNLWDILDGKYQLLQLYAENGFVKLKTSSKGVHNFEISKKKAEVTGTDRFDFHLNRIRLKNIRFDYQYLKANQHYQFDFKDVLSKLSYTSDAIETNLEGNCYVGEIRLGEQQYAANQNMLVNGLVYYELKSGALSIYPTNIQLGTGNFELEGLYDPQHQNHLYLKLKGLKTNFKTLLAFSPNEVRKQLKDYQTRGDVYFSAKLDGSLADRKQPAIEVSFGCQRVSLAPPDYPAKIENLSFKGFFSNGKSQKPSTSILRLDSLSGMLNGKEFKGNFNLSNLNKPKISGAIKSTFLAEDLHGFYPIENVERFLGLIEADLNFSGIIEQPRGFKTTGSLKLKNLEIKHQAYPHTILIDTANIDLKQQEMLIHLAYGEIANSDFKIKGSLNGWNHLLNDDWKKTNPVFELESRQLNLNELLQTTNSSSSKSATAGYDFPKFNLKVIVDELKYDDWVIGQLQGGLKSNFTRQMRLENIKAQVLEGNVLVHGLLELDQSASLFSGSADLVNVNLKELFQRFNDFDLDAISYKNLEGRLNLHFSSQLIFDEHWNTQWHLMDAVLAGHIKNGKLINYEPMLQLAGFMQNKDLENISFSELTDTIFINSNTITLPRMEIKSSVGNMFVSGFQEIDGEMEYHVQVPLKNFKRPDKDEAFGAIEDDGLGNGNIFLLIKGTTQDYKITFDKKEMISKIKKDLKKEKKEFSSLFKKKQKEKQVSLGKDYFR